MIKKIIPLVLLLTPLTSLTSCNKESKYPTVDDNPLKITCTKGPMTLYLKSSSETTPIDKLNLMWSKDMKRWEEKEIIPLPGKEAATCWSIELNEGESIYFAGNNPMGFSYIAYSEEEGHDDVLSFTFTDIDSDDCIDNNDAPNSKFIVSGNVMSLIQAKHFNNLKLPESAIFSFLFRGSNVENAEDLILPSEKLTFGCFACMFENCYSLTKAPILPSTELSDYCYESMFDQCSSLQVAPVLPATTLKNHCYDKMFNDCTKLNYVKVGFGESNTWPTVEGEKPTKNWLSGVCDSGAFEWAGTNGAEIETGDDSVPSDWIIKHADL